MVICSYHRSNDEITIRKKLKEYGFNNVVNSEGYMYFPNPDEDITRFVRGVLRATKGD